MEYRKASAEDAALVTALRTEFLEEINGRPCPEELIRSIRAYFDAGLSDGSAVFYLAEENGTVAGAACLSLYTVAPNFSNPTGREGYVSNVYTRAAFRRRGVARGLVRWVIAEAAARGCARIGLNATVMGRPLYESLGFAPDGGELSLKLPKEDPQPL